MKLNDKQILILKIFAKILNKIDAIVRASNFDEECVRATLYSLMSLNLVDVDYKGVWSATKEVKSYLKE